MKTATNHCLAWLDECVNEVEMLLIEQLHEYLGREEGVNCDCDICLQDIACIVLNRVSPRYCSNPVENAAPSLDRSAALAVARSEIDNLLPIAIEQVALHPHH